MTENVEPVDIKDMYKDTYCYTYKVTMLIQVLAANQEIADIKVDQEGGYISKREVSLQYSTLLHKDGIERKEEKE